jgi:hypothetical protein
METTRSVRPFHAAESYTIVEAEKNWPYTIVDLEPSRSLTVVESRGQPPSHEGAGEANKVLILELVKNILKDQATR